ncbi:MerR family transcriptional regulator [Clostridium sp. CF011]|uniref:MerR family transcriptional regulator n=1 Tax=Clostridium sp. CF011 TaxID=2843318 RepID=UPI001C0DBA8B|nr:MerR family transcriptional regulator [Clostridium sp. CF011]MBU3093919.1 MerR family transcriptional regulator [Clostridium sp. CF011]WAG68840.1 MerR family transcriptional regulator [Clostridium sp. CF011]
MLSIGEFSKICQVSTKTLRYYAEISLINPEEINPENGYRYYSIKQLETMLLIKRLKSYEISLEEIKTLLQLEKDQFEEKLIVLLNKKKYDIQAKVTAYDIMLQQLSNDIQNLQKGESVFSNIKDLDIMLVEVPAMYILSIRKLVSIEECNLGYDVFFNQLYKRIAEDGLTMIGPPMTIYHSEEYLFERYDIEFAIPIKEYVTGTKDFNPGLCIKTRLKGAYSEITSVYAKQHEWVEQERYCVAKPPFDVYVTNPLETERPKDFITDVYLPVKKV